MRYIFVYGSLMRGFWNYNRYLDQRAKFIGAGRLKGELFHLPEGYPAFIEGEGIVWGEIMEVPDQSAISALDRLEGYIPGNNNNLYNRVLKKVELTNGEQVTCWMYIYNNVENAKENGEFIADGDWKAYMENEGGI